MVLPTIPRLCKPWQQGIAAARIIREKQLSICQMFTWRISVALFMSNISKLVYSGVEIFRSFRKYKKNKCLPICFTGPVCSHILTREGHLGRENYSPLCFPTIAIVRDWLLNSHKGQASRDVAQSWLERKGYGCFEETSERSVETVRHIFTAQLSNSTSRYLIQK